MLNNRAAIIFDFDGVLVNSEPLHEWAIRTSISHLGWTFTREDFYRHIVGRGDHNAYRRIAEWNRSQISDEQIHLLLKAKWELMAQGIAERRFEEQPDAADVVRKAHGLGPIAVCSGSVRATVDPLLRTLNLRQYLSTLVCGDDVPNMKPAPDGYLLAARQLAVDPTQCLAIEDTPTGIKSAKAAGMFVIGVAHTVPRDMLHEADAVLESIAELLNPSDY